jgi:methylmalonyl-CoA/ethylmalonyl-CoA epimerase
MLENTLVDQVAIAVFSIEKSLVFYQKTLGLKLHSIEEVPSEKVKVAILMAGETRIELLEPLSKDSPISSFLEKKGEGVHHIALRVSNLHETTNLLRDKNLKIIEPAPRKGSENSKVTFVHPHSTHGVLLELVER